MVQEACKIHDLSWDGRGVSRDNGGRVVMISGAVPGDLVRAHLLSGGKKNLLSGMVKEIVTPSPDRVAHPCGHNDAGCPASPLGIWDYRAALAWKRNHLNETLRRLGGCMNPVIKETVAAPEQWGYRDRLELHLEAYGGAYRLGYISSTGFIPIGDCLLGSSAVRRGISSLISAMRMSGCNPRDGMARILIRDNGHGGAVAVIFLERQLSPFFGTLQQVLEKTELAGWQIRFVREAKVRFFFSRLMAEGGDARIFHQITDLGELITDPTVFSQANHSGSALLRSRILNEIPTNGYLLDLYGGYGAFGLEYVRMKKGRALIMESSGAAVDAGRVFAKAHALPVEFVVKNLNQGVDPVALKGGDTLLLDPPRAGASPVLIQSLNEAGPKRVIYISCHPAALSRDLKLLSGYQAESFVVIDLFPQTPNLETLATLKRR